MSAKPNFRPFARPALAAVMAGAVGALLAAAMPAATQVRQVMPGSPVTAAEDEVERFCGNIADAARDRRYALQKQEIEALEAEIDARVKSLEAKRAEVEEWMKMRQDFIAQASENVVKIYARMRPDAAAERLATLEAELAAAIMMKLDVKQSGLIMSEMESKAAAALTVIMAAAANREDPT